MTTEAERKLMIEQLIHNHLYHNPADAAHPGPIREAHETVRKLTLQLAVSLQSICADSRQLSIAQTKLEEVRMWANAAIACKGIRDPEEMAGE